MNQYLVYFALLEPLVERLAKIESNAVDAANNVRDSISNSIKDSKKK